jgi:hypothetical protein
MRVSRSVALIVVVLLLTTVSTVTGFLVSPGGYLSPLASPPLAGATGGIEGNISIGNVYPVCTRWPTMAPAPPYYNQIKAVITPSSSPDLPLMVPVNWALFNGCVVEGTFTIGLNPGVYSLTITSCYAVYSDHYLGAVIPFCPGLPKTAIVESGVWTQVDISITTGIY